MNTETWMTSASAPSGSARRSTRARARSERSRPEARILLVDDNRDAVLLMDEFLRLQGYRTAVAFDGLAALDQMRRQDFCVGIFDIEMPLIDGYELARRVRRDVAPEMRLLALTGYGQPEDREQALDAGFDRHLVKPVAPALLTQLLDEMLLPNYVASPNH